LRAGADFWAFRGLQRATFLPAPDVFLIALQSAAGRALATPSEPPQNLPRMSGVIVHTTFLDDQMGYAVGGLQAGFIAERPRPAFESTLDLIDLIRIQPRLASGAASLAKSGQPFGVQLGRPSAYGLPMGADPARDFRLAEALGEQTRRAHAPPLQCFEVPADACWK